MNDELPEKKAAKSANSRQSASGDSEEFTPPLRRLAGQRDLMPRDFRISLDAKGGTDRWLMNPGGERLHRMRGFEAQYTDIVDYILRITHRIWEQKDIGYIYDTYKHNSHVHDDYGLQYGREKIVADTVHTINAFPDIRLFADEVIWAGNDEVGFHTSHRTVIVGHNIGYSRYGPPTGKKVTLWCIANCVSLENEIFEEWVIYDTAALLRQLGFDLREKAREFANLLEVIDMDLRRGEPERLLGQGKPTHLPPPSSTGFDVEDFLRRTYHYAWNWRMLGRLDDSHAANLRFRGSTGRAFTGLGEYKSFVLSILAMFPNLLFKIDDLYWMGNDQDGYLAAVRWSIIGDHRGYGIYGPPTGRRVNMWGISQHHLQQGKIVEEWMLFNEFAVMQQIFRD